jgi:hypothetical protein
MRLADALQGRVRCRAFGQRVTHGLSVCPYCGHQPVRFHTRWRATLLSVLAGLVLGFLLFPFAPHPQALGLSIRATETPRAVAAARPTFTPTPTATPLPTATATNTATPAPPSPTATNTTVRVVQSTPTATSVPPTATPRPTVAPPRLLNPPDRQDVSGDDTEILLRWEGSLQEEQQFEVKLYYVDRNNDTKLAGHRTRDPRWRITVPKQVFIDISLSLRAIKWDVTIIDANGNAVSAPSESRIFYWR